jgi:branched-chain amino acid transport system ATP-binding protein
MLKIEDIHTYYGDSYVLQGVSLEVPKGSITVLLGRNGMGKTTLIRTAIGFMYPRRGRVFFKDIDVTGMPPYERVRMGMGLIPQGRRVFRSLSVEENLIIGALNSTGERRLEKIYELFPRLKERSHHPGNKLSGGEQQMLAIARAMIGNPQLLLMDEPTEGLAPVLVLTVSDIISRLKQEGFSILLVEQNMPFALKVGNYVHILNRGRVVYSSSPQGLLENPEVQRRFLGI